jgi:hypothetical protein
MYITPWSAIKSNRPGPGQLWGYSRPESAFRILIPDSTTRPRELLEPPPISRGAGGPGTNGGLPTATAAAAATAASQS